MRKTLVAAVTVLAALLCASCGDDTKPPSTTASGKQAAPKAPAVDPAMQREVESLKKAVLKIQRKGISLTAKRAAMTECDALVETLGTNGAKIVPALEAAYCASKDPQLRAKVMKALRKTRAKEAIPVFERALRDGDREVCTTALASIRDFVSDPKKPVIDRGRAAKIILRATGGGNEVVVEQAIHCLHAFYDYPVIPRLEVLAKDARPLVKKAAQEVIKRIRDSRAELERKGKWSGIKKLPE